MNKIVMIICLAVFNQARGMDQSLLRSFVQDMCHIPTPQEREALFNTPQQIKAEETNTIQKKEHKLPQDITSALNSLEIMEQKLKKQDKQLENLEKQVKTALYLNTVASTIKNLEKKEVEKKPFIFTKNVSIAEGRSLLLDNNEWKKNHAGCITRPDSFTLHVHMWWLRQLPRKRTDEQEIKNFSIKTDKKSLSFTPSPSNIAFCTDKQNQLFIEIKDIKYSKGTLFPIEGIEIIKNPTT